MKGVNKVILIGNLGADPASVVRRFWSKVAIGEPSECWEWLGAKSRGYGLLSSKQGEAPFKAHRLAYELFVGTISSGQVVRHKCDNPSCCNPFHLDIGTHRDNVMDRVRRGRTNPKSLKNLRPGHRGFYGAGPSTKKENNPCAA